MVLRSNRNIFEFKGIVFDKNLKIHVCNFFAQSFFNRKKWYVLNEKNNPLTMDFSTLFELIYHVNYDKIHLVTFILMHQ